MFREILAAENQTLLSHRYFRNISAYSSDGDERILALSRRHLCEELGHAEMFRECLVGNGVALRKGENSLFHWRTRTRDAFYVLSEVLTLSLRVPDTSSEAPRYHLIPLGGKPAPWQRLATHPAQSQRGWMEGSVLSMRQVDHAGIGILPGFENRQVESRIRLHIPAG